MATGVPRLAPSPLSGLRRHGRLLRTDFRRSYGVILLVLMVLIGWYGAILFGGRAPTDIVLWGDVSTRVAWSFAMIGPIAGGWGAWLASRERRSGSGDLLASIAMPTGLREARVLVVPVLAALLAYGLVAVVTLGRAWPDSTWGGPVWPVIAIGAAFTVGYTLVGTAAGVLLHQRLMPFAVAFGLFMFTIVSYTYVDINSRFTWLAPFRWVADPNAYDQILYRANGTTWNEVAVPIALTLGVVALVALVLLLVRAQRRSAVVAVILAALILVPSVNAAMQDSPRLIAGLGAGSQVWGSTPVENPPLVCTGDTVELCVHVIYTNRIDDIDRIVDALVQPVAGFPGTDIRIEQRADLPSTDGIVRFDDDWLWGSDDYHVANVVVSAVLPGAVDANGEDAGIYGPRTPVQAAIAQWLIGQAGVPGHFGYMFTTVEYPEDQATQSEWDARWAETERVQVEVNAAAERFGALPEDVRDAWLADNWAAVRAGDLTLEDIP